MSATAILVLSFLLITVHTSVANAVDVKLGMLHFSSYRDTPLKKFYLFPAAQIAFETIAKRSENGRYKDFNMSYVSTDACCTRPVRSSGALAASLYREDGVDAFLGPAYSSDIVAVADMAAYWNLPVVSGVSASTILDDKARFATLTRTGFVLNLLVKFMTAVFRNFDWTQCAILRGLPGGGFYMNTVIPDAVYTGLWANGITANQVFADQFDTLDEAIERAISVSKVVFIGASPVRDIMVRARRLGFTSGSHVFLSWYPNDFDESPRTSFLFENNDAEEIEALDALLEMRFRVPDTAEYDASNKELRARQLALYGREGSGNPYAATTHDAVLMYADVINEIVAECGDVRDGRAVTEKMRNRTFQGATGPFRISENGDRYGACELLDLTDTDKGTYSVVGTYDESTDVINVTSIKWPGGCAPLAI